MSDGRSKVESFIGEELHGLLFLEEFVYPRSEFITPRRDEVEFADAVVVLGDTLLVCQIKERDSGSVGDAETERRWFDRATKKAAKQVRDTLSYLRDFDDIPVKNMRGRVSNLAASAYTHVIKIVLYHGAPNLPDDCRAIRHKMSSTAGLIHVLDASDYLSLLRTLRVPSEVVHYFLYRERLLTNFAEVCGPLPEQAIAGHFIGGESGELPTTESLSYLHALRQDEENWDIAPILRTLHDNLNSPGSDDHYAILLEFAKLRRSHWREVLVRMRLSFEAAKTGNWRKPFRIQDGDVGFVFVPVHPEIAADPAWARGGNVAFLQSMMGAHKYDRRLTRCVGYQVAYEGEGSFAVTWGYIDYPWAHNPKIEEVLARNFPFRPVREGRLFGFVFNHSSVV